MLIKKINTTFSRTGIALIAPLLFCLGVFAQPGRIISTKDGLPQSFVSGLEQDQTGFIWIATRNGLARYDGRNFKIFQHSNEDSTTIASNLIISIQKRKNELWLEYESGEIDRLDIASEKVSHFIRHKFFQHGSFLRGAWMIDSKGVFWAIHEEKGLVIYDDKRARRVLSSNEFVGGTLWGITEASDGFVWVVTQRGISKVDPASGQAVHFQSQVTTDFFEAGQSMRFPVALYQRHNGELMWADRQRLYFFSSATGKFRIIPLSGKSQRGVVWIRPGEDGSEYFEREGTLYRYHDKTGLVLVHSTTVGNLNPLQSFLIDKAGMVWLGTNAHGIVQIDLNTPFFPSYPIQQGFAGDILQKEFGISIAGTFDWQPEDSRSSAPGYHLRSAYDKNESLWIGLKETVVRYDVKKKKFESLPPIPGITSADGPGAGIKGLTFTPEGLPVVIGYNGNVLYFDPLNGVWSFLLAEGFLKSRLRDNLNPRDIYLDRDRIWITTEMDGLLLVDIKTRHVQQLRYSEEGKSLPTNQLLGLCPDPTRPDLLWIGSYNGLICLNKKTLLAEHFGTAQGLPDQTVYSLLPDKSGHLWFGTNKGLCRFNPISQTIKVFQTRHGLPEDEFNRFHQLLLPDGRLAFGGTAGWTIFDPLIIKDDLFEPEVALTGLKINNSEVEPGRSEILNAPLNTVPELVLPFDQNSVQFSFAGLQFNQPGDLLYRYQLEGYDKDWIEVGNTPLAAYTKIPPGKYQLRLNASNTSGEWSRYVKTLDIKIHPPWWSTWWAFVLYALATAIAISYWVRLQLTRLELRRSVEIKQQEARQLQQLSEMKSRFFTNITHDFRTPLTLILSPLQGMIDEQRDEMQRRKLASVKRNAEQLLTLINQLMEFSKAETGKLSLNESRGDLSLFVENLIGLFREEAIAKEISLTLESHLSGDFWFDGQKLDRILGNLVGNAIKFTGRGGAIRVLLEMKNTRVVVSVLDTGIGISENSLPFIFDRYYQASSNQEMSQESQGSGIGLALVKELVVLLNGTIQAQSTQGKGSTFRVELPLQPADSMIADRPSISKLSQTKPNDTVDEESIVILLVEDNNELADFVAGSLPDAYQVVRASNGAEGLQLALEYIPDLIISDVMMPLMDGLELCQKVKAHDNTRHIPLILLTAKVSLDSRMEGLEMGADDYLSKPFHVPELNLRVHNLLERESRLRQRLKAELSSPNEETPEAMLPEQDPFLKRLLEVVETHLGEPEIGVAALSEKMNLSRSQLHRKVRAVSGLPVSELVRNYRLTRAAFFLREGFTSSESAYKVGFDSPAYFSKCFHSFYGMTPSEYSRSG